jgi:hypothetical protein
MGRPRAYIPLLASVDLKLYFCCLIVFIKAEQCRDGGLTLTIGKSGLMWTLRPAHYARRPHHQPQYVPTAAYSLCVRSPSLHVILDGHDEV